MSYTQLAEGLLTTEVLTRPSKLDSIRTCSVLANFMPSTYFPVSFACSLKKIFTTTQKLLPSFFFENRNNNVIMEVSFWLLSICYSDWFQDPELHTQKVTIPAQYLFQQGQSASMSAKSLSITPYSPLKKLSQAFACFKNNNAFPFFSASICLNNVQAAAKLIVGSQPRTSRIM